MGRHPERDRYESTYVQHQQLNSTNNNSNKNAYNTNNNNNDNSNFADYWALNCIRAGLQKQQIHTHTAADLKIIGCTHTHIPTYIHVYKLHI